MKRLSEIKDGQAICTTEKNDLAFRYLLVKEKKTWFNNDPYIDALSSLNYWYHNKCYDIKKGIHFGKDDYPGQKYEILDASDFLEKENTDKRFPFLLSMRNAISIYDLACTTWKEKLEKIFFNRNTVANNQVVIQYEFYKEMRDACTNEQHKLFDDIFGKDEVFKFQKGKFYTYPNNLSKFIAYCTEDSDHFTGPGFDGLGYEFRYVNYLPSRVLVETTKEQWSKTLIDKVKSTYKLGDLVGNSTKYVTKEDLDEFTLSDDNLTFSNKDQTIQYMVDGIWNDRKPSELKVGMMGVFYDDLKDLEKKEVLGVLNTINFNRKLPFQSKNGLNWKYFKELVFKEEK